MIGRDGSVARGSGTGVCAGRNHLCYNFFRRLSRNAGQELSGAPKEFLKAMSSTKSKLRLMGAFAALATLALAIS